MEYNTNKNTTQKHETFTNTVWKMSLEKLNEEKQYLLNMNIMMPWDETMEKVKIITYEILQRTKNDIN